MVPAIASVLFLLIPNPGSGIRLELYSTTLDQRYVVVVTQADLDKAPSWQEDAENPPLSARKAMKLADAMKEKTVKDTDKFRWKRMETTLIELTPRQWYWQVTYWALPRVGDFSTGVPSDLRLVVLMDGTVIQPKTTRR